MWQLASDGGEWQRSFGIVWHPRHRYAEDIAAAKELQAEMVRTGLPVGVIDRGAWCSASFGDLVLRGQTEPIALCLLWLAWRGVAVEWRPESEKDN